jgi:Cu(I)/Ag(I) efflux system membrane protein CusA/SilA
VRIRYPQELRDSPERLANVLIPVNRAIGMSTSTSAPVTGGMASAGGMALDASAGRMAQVPLGQVATIRTVPGPMVVRTEDAMPTAWVYVDVAGRDIGGYVAEARQRVNELVRLPAGYTIGWSGQYEYMVRAKERMKLVIPATLAIVFLLLYFNFRNVGETLIVMLSVPFALVGGIWYLWLLGYNWSGRGRDRLHRSRRSGRRDGVVMLIYLDHAWKAKRLPDPGHPFATCTRPCGGRGGACPAQDDDSDGNHGRVAADPVGFRRRRQRHEAHRGADGGGMISSTILTLVVIPRSTRYGSSVRSPGALWSLHRRLAT